MSRWVAIIRRRKPAVAHQNSHSRPKPSAANPARRATAPSGPRSWKSVEKVAQAWRNSLGKVGTAAASSRMNPRMASIRAAMICWMLIDSFAAARSAPTGSRAAWACSQVWIAGSRNSSVSARTFSGLGSDDWAGAGPAASIPIAVMRMNSNRRMSISLTGDVSFSCGGKMGISIIDRVAPAAIGKSKNRGRISCRAPPSVAAVTH